MNKSYQFNQISDSLSSAQNVSILLPRDLNYDIVASSLALHLSLQKAGKNSAVSSPREMTVEFSSLVGVDKIGQKISGKNLIIYLDYSIEAVEKISWNDDSGKVNLIVVPKAGAPAITADKANVSNEESGADLIFLIGGKSPEDFGKPALNGDFKNKNTVWLSQEFSNQPFAKISVTDSSSSGFSEMVTAILSALSLPLDEDIAQNLFLGLKSATDNFSGNLLGADTFEAAAVCLRAGAKHKKEAGQKKIQASSPAPAPDWLGPKIYRGGALP
ncbi:hypothetical protein FJZ40_01650 [Candidatus Shapirobacteria bacterium]|nr:hypothetical protein [Candidatus Shapirobacteria bacterium]